MDLHVVGPLASPAERAAVDAVLGPPQSGWAGGTRNPAVEGHASRGGHEARSRRDLLIPVLHAVQSRIGWISQPALNYVCRRLTVPPAEAWGVATFYALFATSARPPVVAHVCDDLVCRMAGGESLCTDLERTLGPADEPARDGRATWLRSPCLGLCDRAPAALFTIAGPEPATIGVAPVDTVGVVSRLDAGAAGTTIADDQADVRTFVPQVGQPGLRLLARVGLVDPTSLADYRDHGGYAALRRAFELGPDATIAEVTASKLMGRGGAAFPTGRKWAAVAAAPAQPHYLVCNADESEPGTFKDRVLMEHDPFAVVESMAIEAFAVGAKKAYLYVRGEYPLAEARMANAIAASTEAGLLGDLDIELRRGAGAYICGEETALFESIEGKRGEPRNKPPFPVEVGLFDKPTAVNNVETLVNVLLIVGEEGGGAKFAATGTEGSTGPKLFCLSGNVARPGLYEVPFGTTLRELLDLGGGVPDGRAIKAVLLGGAAGVFVGPDSLDTPLTFEGTRAIGATLGSGVVMVFDETADMVGALRRIARFFRDESCGQCVPCRVGTVRQEELLARLAGGSANGRREDELALLAEIGQAMRDASICGLGQTASSAIESALREPELVEL
ncbi:MAG TPA: NAD(P)H-dependent oxidoreductase subunit E [Candidatus Limnocylindrales bacterium]|jgi:NADH-quinone oxidoreductase subunit F|nr:NAD(P)H-dependent oxidoreductase subunit E [Candidatus Limnocylindrales bacterium]